MAVDAVGNLYIADYGNGRVRVLRALAANTPWISARGIVNSASLREGQPLAPDSLVSLFGVQLADLPRSSNEIPLPRSMGGTTVRIADRSGAIQIAQLQFIAPGQINFLLPTGLGNGPALVTVLRDGVDGVPQGIDVAPVAPGLFSMNANGQGVAAAFAVRVSRDGEVTTQPVYRFDERLGRFVFQPIVINSLVDDLFLTLFGTGIRGRSSLSSVSVTIGGVNVPVSFAGPQGDFPGLDQVNVGPLPGSLKADPGEFDIGIAVDGIQANIVQVGLF